MNLCSNNVEWCETITYLNVYLQSGKYIEFDVNSAKIVFYAVYNFSSGVKNDIRLSLLHIQETYSLSILLHSCT